MISDIGNYIPKSERPAITQILYVTRYPTAQQ